MAIRPGNPCAGAGRIGDVVLLRGRMFQMIFVASGKVLGRVGGRKFCVFEARGAHIKDFVKVT